MTATHTGWLKAASALVALWPALAFAQPAGNGVPVTVATATVQDVPIIERTIGTVQPFQSVLVRARVDGTLDKVAFTEGQMVKPGDLLAQLDPRPYQAVLDQVVAKRAADEAMVISNRADLVRYTDLAQSAVASRQKLEQTKAAVAQNEAAVRGDEAQIAAAELNLEFTRITAPIEGRVGLRLVDPGNFVRVADATGSGLVTITQIQPIALTFTFPQDLLQKVQTAMRRGTLPVLAYTSDGATKLAQGELLTIDSAIDQTTGTIKLKAVFANKDNALWPGQFVNVNLQLDLTKGAITVPSQAVQRGQEGLYTFVMNPDNTVVAKAIQVSQDDGRTAIVTAGLNAGDKVVLTGQSRLTNGTKVAATSAAPEKTQEKTGS